MRIKEFKLERYFAKYEFSARYLLSSSDCDGMSLDYVLQCAGEEESRLWHDLKLGYTESKGLPQLREEIARQYTSMTSENIIVLSPGEASFCLMNVLLEKDDHVVCMSPAYQSLYQVAESLGCRMSYWKPDESTWHFDPADLRRLVTPKTKLIILNFPHNPTGFLPSEKEIMQIIGIAREHGIVIFSDEMYHRLVHDPSRSSPSLCDLYENAVSLWGMAKSFGLAGLRLGWLASSNKEILEQIVAYKDYLTICNSATSEVLSLIALRHTSKFIDPNLRKIRANLEILLAFQKKHQDFITLPMPQAGSTAFIRLNLQEPTLNYCERLVVETGVMLLPSEMFDFGNRHARIGLGREQMPAALEAWNSYIMR